jgi:hypothetical protein
VLGRCTTSDLVSLLCIFQTKLLCLRHFSCLAYVRQVIWWDFVACMNGWIHECRERFCVVRNEYITIVCSNTSKIRCVTRGFTFHYIKPWNQDTLASIKETRSRKSNDALLPPSGTSQESWSQAPSISNTKLILHTTLLLVGLLCFCHMHEWLDAWMQREVLCLWEMDMSWPFVQILWNYDALSMVSLFTIKKPSNQETLASIAETHSRKSIINSEKKSFSQKKFKAYMMRYFLQATSHKIGSQAPSVFHTKLIRLCCLSLEMFRSASPFHFRIRSMYDDWSGGFTMLCHMYIWMHGCANHT